jgi:hypothetical protein
VDKGTNHEKHKEDGKTVTVLKRHGTIGRGLLRTMGKQLEEHSMESKTAPRESLPTVQAEKLAIQMKKKNHKDKR